MQKLSLVFFVCIFLLTRAWFTLEFCAKCMELNWVQLISNFCHVRKFEVHSKQRIHLFSSAVSWILLRDLFFKIVLPRQYCFTRHDLLLCMCPWKLCVAKSHRNWIKNNKERTGTYSLYIGLNIYLEYINLFKL